MHAYFASVDADETQERMWNGERLQERSHGESFLTVLRYRGFLEAPPRYLRYLLED
jgi:predicted ATPase